MKHILTITDENGDAVVTVRLDNVKPLNAASVVIDALAGIEPNRKTRSDAGTTRKPEPTTV
mgnify:CR=1 FL=1